MLNSLVADFAFLVHECSSETEALALYAAQRPDWVLPDWVLMDIDTKTTRGISAIREVKAACPEAKIIIVTSYDDADIREAAQEAGACAYVLKENLLAIRELIGNPHFMSTRTPSNLQL